MSALVLPEPIAAYLKAITQSTGDVARCFTLQGILNDNGQTHIGRAAINAWRAQCSKLWTYSIVPFSLELNVGVHAVHCHVAGNFAGFHKVLKFSFRLERGLIARLDITE